MKTTTAIFILALFAIPCAGQAEENAPARVIRVDVNSWISFEKSSSSSSQQVTFVHLDPIIIYNPNPVPVRFERILLMCYGKEGVGTGLEIYKEAGKENLTGKLMIPPQKLFETVADVIVMDTKVSLETKGFVVCPGVTDNKITLTLFMQHEPIFSASALIPNKEKLPPHTRPKEGFPIKFRSDW